MSIVAGIDFGTAGVRVSLIDSERGRLGTGAVACPVRRRADDANFATQSHEDHCRVLTAAFEMALADAHLPGHAVAALAVATTGSTVIPLDEHLRPLDDYALWCDHRAWREAAEITSRAREWNLAALDGCGGSYSSEWGFAKVLYWLRTHPQDRGRFFTAMEHCDFMVATLCGLTDPSRLPRSVCAMGHKWMWNEALGGLPSDDFLVAVDPLTAGVRDRLQGRYLASNQLAGGLCPQWAQRLGLKAGIPIPVGALDAHWDALGAGCRVGDLVNVIGTSSCIMALSDLPRRIPGVSGVVAGSIHPDKVGIEAGLAAVGDVFDAIARRAGQTVAALAAKVENYQAGQTDLLRIVWDNGDRCVLSNSRLRGITWGWRLYHGAEDEFFAALEGTALHTRIVMERLREYGVPIERIIHGGGIPRRNDTLNRVYAGVLGKPVLVPAADTTGLGAAIFAFLAAGTFKTIEEAQDALSPGYRTIEPRSDDVRIYENLFARFRDLYFTFGNLEENALRSARPAKDEPAIQPRVRGVISSPPG
jgi:L-ribulokinase